MLVEHLKMPLVVIADNIQLVEIVAPKSMNPPSSSSYAEAGGSLMTEAAFADSSSKCPAVVVDDYLN